MRVKYKPIVDRFGIPRPTLIEWQKREKADKKNWRVKHLSYLRRQTIVEKETANELKSKGILPIELFKISAFFLLKNIERIPEKNEFYKLFREFSINQKSSLQLQHDFSKKIWDTESKSQEGEIKKICDYYQVFDLIKNLTSAQYYIFLEKILDFKNNIVDNNQFTEGDGIDGKTWQELWKIDKELSWENMEKFFKTEGII